jgi:HlyD family secretion protein
MSVRFAPETTDGVVTYKAVLAVENAEALLRPGMTATATITVARTEGALTVPNAALRYAPPRVAPQGSGGPGGLAGLVMPSRPQEQAGTADGRSVWVLRAGSPVRVEVAIGDSDASRTIVTSDDLAAGDEVITGQRSGGPG